MAWYDDLVAAVAAQVPAGRDGIDGTPGMDGVDGKPGPPGRTACLFIEDYPGANDTEQLRAAMAAAKAMPNRPPIQLQAKTYSFGPITAYDGFRLIGAPVVSHNAERSGAGAVATKVTCTGTGSWLTAAPDVKAGQSWDVSIRDIAFTGNKDLTWLTGGTTVLWCWGIAGVSFNSFRSVLGTQAEKLLITACHFTEWWDVAGCYQGAVHLGGSDSTLWPQGGLFDSNTAYLTPGNSSGQYHVWLDGLSKTSIGPIYVTAEGGWGGVRSTGGISGGPVWIRDAVIEGRNAGAPGQVACLRVDGGWVDASGLWASYCTAPPIQVTGGRLVLTRGAYGAAATAPSCWIDSKGGETDASHCYSTTAKPTLRKTGGTVTIDGSLAMT